MSSPIFIYEQLSDNSPYRGLREAQPVICPDPLVHVQLSDPPGQLFIRVDGRVAAASMKVIQVLDNEKWYPEEWNPDKKNDKYPGESDGG